MYAVLSPQEGETGGGGQAVFTQRPSQQRLSSWPGLTMGSWTQERTPMAATASSDEQPPHQPSLCAHRPGLPNVRALEKELDLELLEKKKLHPLIN